MVQHLSTCTGSSPLSVYEVLASYCDRDGAAQVVLVKRKHFGFDAVKEKVHDFSFRFRPFEEKKTEINALMNVAQEIIAELRVNQIST